MPSRSSWERYFHDLLWKRRQEASSFTATWLGGPHDGESRQFPKGWRSVSVYMPKFVPALYMEPDELGPVAELSTMNIACDISRYWTPLIWDEDSDWVVGVVEWRIIWPRVVAHGR